MADDSRGVVGRATAWLRRAPDVAVIFVWAAVAGYIAGARVSFLGDGIRHLDPILAGSRPILGEPRWLLYPAFLFAVIKPLQVTGIVTSTRDAAHAFVALDFTAGAVYLMLIRRWLMARGVKPASRAAAVLIAGMTAPLLRYSTDTIEPLVPATIALAGLVYLASRPVRDKAKGLLVAGAAIALASLLYQGMILAVALVPLAAERGGRFKVCAIAIFCAILAAVPVVMLTTMVATENNSPRTAIHRIMTGEENSLFKQLLWQRVTAWPKWMRYAAVASIGPARSIVMTPRDDGISRNVRMLSNRKTFIEGAFGLSGMLFALALILAGAVATVRRRDWRIPIAFAGLLVLPIVRPFGYSYLKFFVLMPAVVAVVASSAPTAIVFGAGATVGAFNITNLARQTGDDRRLASDIAPLYESAGTSACFLTTGWGAPAFGWPGWGCSMSYVLSRARTEQVDEMTVENSRGMIDAFRRCFCESSAVFTDDVAAPSRNAVIDLAQYYRFSGFDLDSLIWNSGRGEIAFDRDGVRLYRYASRAQGEICAALQAAAHDGSR